jgi:hypothetical protein
VRSQCIHPLLEGGVPTGVQVKCYSSLLKTECISEWQERRHRRDGRIVTIVVARVTRPTDEIRQERKHTPGEAMEVSSLAPSQGHQSKQR